MAVLSSQAKTYLRQALGNRTAANNIIKMLDLTRQAGANSASGLLFGRGTEADPATTATADGKFIELRCQTTATSGDNRLVYLRYDQKGAGGGGECLRASSFLSAAVGTARGAQISLEVSSTGYVSGLGVGCDAQLYVTNTAVHAAGTYFAGQSEIYMLGSTSSLAAVTNYAIHSFIANGDATGVATVLNALAFKGSAGTGKMIYNNTGTDPANSNGSIRILVDEGSGYAARYLMYYDQQAA
jgi:hypothetical protein